MGSEQLNIPEDNLRDVVEVIRTGLEHVLSKSNDVSDTTREALNKWCDEIEDHYWGAPTCGCEGDEWCEECGECENTSCTSENPCEDCTHALKLHQEREARLNAGRS